MLTNGYHVEGINLSPTQKTEHLSMYTGRNDLFRLVSIDEINKIHSVIIINEYDNSEQNKEGMALQQNLLSCYERGKMNVKELNLPLLYGEWMPMNKEGMFRLSEYIAFESDVFRENAIYIKCFTNWLVTLIAESEADFPLVIYLRESNLLSEQILEKRLEIHDNVPRINSLAGVLSHYEKFKDYY